MGPISPTIFPNKKEVNETGSRRIKPTSKKTKTPSSGQIKNSINLRRKNGCLKCDIMASPVAGSPALSSHDPLMIYEG